MLLSNIQLQFVQSEDLEPADPCLWKDRSVALLALQGSQPKKVFIVLVALLVCCAANSVLAQSTSALGVANKTNTQSNTSASPLQSNRELRPGQVIEGELKSEDIHRYAVALKAGEYMKVAIQGFGFGFVMNAIDPSGNEIAKIELGGS